MRLTLLPQPQPIAPYTSKQPNQVMFSIQLLLENNSEKPLACADALTLADVIKLHCICRMLQGRCDQQA